MVTVHKRRKSFAIRYVSVDEKFKSWRKLTGELRQYHPSLRISIIKELPKGDFVAIGDSLQDVIILQNEGKMKVKTLRLVSLKPSKPAKNSQKVLQSKEYQPI